MYFEGKMSNLLAFEVQCACISSFVYRKAMICNSIDGQ